MLLGVQNGVLDLETGELRDGQPEDGITRVSLAVYDPGARCPRFEQFLREIFAEHHELPTYIQRVIGYCLTGSRPSRRSGFCSGRERTGTPR